VPDVTLAQSINAERLVLLGWSRAIVLQMTHPLIAAAVADHSHFRASAGAAALRLHETVRSMLSLAFGSAATRAQAIAGIRGIHRRVNGVLRQDVGPFPAGTRYSAEDPALLLWVHATLIDSVVLTYEALIAPLTPEERDEYCRQAAPVAVDLGVDQADVPASWPALQQYLSRTLTSGSLVAGPEARAIVDAVLFPPLSLVTGPFAWVNRLYTIGTLPAPIRDQYRFTWTARRAAQLQRIVRGLHAARRVSPRRLAWWPAARRL
jgi:uncharacterized protein (DUF2236 family)